MSDVSADYIKRLNALSSTDALDRMESIATPAAAPNKPVPVSTVAGNMLFDIGHGVTELPRAVTHGALQGIQGFMDTTHSLAEWLNENVADLGSVNAEGWTPGMKDSGVEVPNLDAPESVTGNLVSGVAQFLTGFGPAMGALRGMNALGKVGKIARPFAAGAAADATVFDPHEARLSDLIQEYPALQNPVTEYLASDQSDGDAEGHFKNALEGLALGGMTEGLFRAVRLIKNRPRRNKEINSDKDSVASVGKKDDGQKATATPEKEAEEQALPQLGDQKKPIIEIPGVTDAKARDVLKKFSPKESGGDHIDEFLKVARGESLYKGPKKPVLSMLKNAGGIDPNGRLAAELRHVGVTNKTMPGLFRRGGLTDGDRFPSVENPLFDEFADDGNGYVDSDAIIEGVRRELAGNPLQNAGDRVAREQIESEAEQFIQFMDEYGIDYRNLDNESIKKRIANIRDDLDRRAAAEENIPPGSARDINDIDAEKAEGIPDYSEGQPVKSKELAININLSRINATDDVKKAIKVTSESFADRIQEARRGTITNEETIKLAESLGMTPETLLARKSGQAFSAEEALAARQILASSGNQIVKLAKKARSQDASPADMIAFRRGLAVHSAIQSQVSGMTAEAGRALQAFNIAAQGSAARDRAIRNLIDSTGGETSNRRMADKLVQIAETNPDKLNPAIKKLANASGWEQIYEIWINSLLSGPQTHAVNILSNSIVALWQIPETLIAAGVSKTIGDGDIIAGEVVGQLYGIVQGAKDGMKAAAKTMWTGKQGDSVLQRAGKVEMDRYAAVTGENFSGTAPGKAVNAVTRGDLERGGPTAKAIDLLGEVVRIPTARGLGAEDDFFKAIGYRMELNRRAFRTAKSEGLSGKRMAVRIRQIVNDPPDDIQAWAEEAAMVQTFTNPLKEGGQAFQRGIRKVPLLRLLAPFIRTPTNIIKFVGVHSPVAPFAKSVREDILAGGARRDMAVAKIALGSTLMLIAADMTASGVVTGGGPSNPKMKAHLRNTGWQPYSFKSGDKYYSYNRLDPVGMFFGLAADTTEILGQVYNADGDDTEVDQLALALVMALAKNVTSKTWMQGVSGAIEALEDPDRYFVNWASNMAGTLIPTGVAQINRTQFDSTLRESRSINKEDRDVEVLQSMLNKIKSRIPGYSKDLPPRVNMWGEPIVLGGGMGPDIVSPIYTSSSVVSEIDKEIVRIGIPLSMPGKTVGGVRLTEHEYHDYVVLAGKEVRGPNGKNLKETLDQLVSGEGSIGQSYKEADDDQRIDVIRSVVNSYRKMARQTLVEKNPELRKAIELNK